VSFVHLEPVRDASSGEIVGREARWQSGAQAAGAHEQGLIDRWALRAATALARDGSRSNPLTLIHVDVRSVTHIDDTHDLYRWLRRLDPSYRNVALEIDAALVARHTKTVAAFARAVRRIGVEVVIDHVRTSEGLEEMLLQVECGALKIDEAVIAEVSEERGPRHDARRIVNLAHAHGMYAIGAGVHDSRRWLAARELGCDRVQGDAEIAEAI